MLFLPASNPRAIAKAREAGADLVVLDLEDAVKPDDKSAARKAAVEAVAEEWPAPVAIRINGVGTGAGISPGTRCAGTCCGIPGSAMTTRGCSCGGRG